MKGGEQQVVRKRSAGDRRREREVSKAGMTASLGGLVVTGFMRGAGASTLHIWAGMALIGFTLWHASLYQPPTSREKKAR